MGRVSAATDVVLGTPQSLSIAVGAVLVTALSYREIYWICAAVIVAAAAYLRVALGAKAQVMALSPANGGGGAELGEHLSEVEAGTGHVRWARRVACEAAAIS